MLVFFLMDTPLPGQNVALGFITQSTGGHVNNAAASAGTTIYDGDQVTTDANGGLTLRFGTSQLILAGHSAVLLKHDGSGLTPILQRGTVAFRAEGVEAFKFGARDVRVRPQSSARTVGRMTLDNCAVLVTSRVQSLEITAGMETKIVEPGKTYRVVFEGACGNRSNQSPPPPSRTRFIVVPIAVAVIFGLGIREAFESPDRP